MSADFTLLAFPDSFRPVLDRWNSIDSICDMDYYEGIDGIEVTAPDLFGFFTTTHADGSVQTHVASGYYSKMVDRIWGDDSPVERQFVGEVSWLKAGLVGDADRYIPGPVREVAKVIGDGCVRIDDNLITRVMVAMNAPNRSIYNHRDRYIWYREYKRCSTMRDWDGTTGVARRQDVKRFLIRNKGRLVTAASE